jgi:hypothetical protein
MAVFSPAEMHSEPPYVDEHAITIAASREVVWTALRRHVAGSLLKPEGHALVRLLGTEPRAGFAVSDSVWGKSLSLVGRHRFARYKLAFELADTQGGATQLSAQTYAAFPGPHGRVYRALVIGTRAHVVATKRILRSIRSLSLELDSAADPVE